MQYYSSYERLLRQYNRRNRSLLLNANSIGEYQEWKLTCQAKLKELLGLGHMELVPPNVECLEKVDFKEYSREKYILEVEQGVFLPYYKLIPKKNSNGHIIISLHGHCTYAKDGVAGVLVGEEAIEIQRYHTAYGLDMVKEGFTVYCPDARGFGERREQLDQGEELTQRKKSSCNSLNFTAISMGMTLIGMWVWDLMRLVDYIKGDETQRKREPILRKKMDEPITIKDRDESITINDIDETNDINQIDETNVRTEVKEANARIHVIGFSGGGLQALFLSALDDRIEKTVISGYYHSYKDTILRTNQCGCNFIPHIYEYLEIGDIGALIAPRPLLIESGDEDRLNGRRGIEDVKEQVNITHGAYDIFNKRENLIHNIYKDGHRWNGKGVTEFLIGK